MSLPVTSRRVDVSLLHPRLTARLEQFFSDPRIRNRVAIVSGVRTKAQQQRLYERYLKKGSPLAANPNRVIATGFKGSWHMVQSGGYGYAVDLRITNRSISEEEVGRIAKDYGLRQTVPSEWWHFQPRDAYHWFEARAKEKYSVPRIDFEAILQFIEDLSKEVAVSPLRKGSRGKAVQLAQRRLGALGFDAGTPDAIFGRKTYRAAMAFQRHTPGLTADGVIGGKTWRAIWSLQP